MHHEKDEFEDHYPTSVMQTRHADAEDLNRRLYELIRDMEAKFADTEENAVASGLVATQGGYQTSVDANFFQLRSPAIKTFHDEIALPAARRYLSRVFGQDAQQFNPWLRGWATVLHEGDWQGPHMHPGEKNLASSVYYVKLPKDKAPPQGCIEFINPHPVSVHHGFSMTRRLQPEEGKLILFPPYHMHYVHPFRGPGERAIISFDVRAQPPGGPFVF